MALPIMLYDEQSLTPAWGYVVNRAWVNLDESIVSILWKFARLNAIAGPVVVSLAARKTIDPYEGVAFTPEHIYIERLANTFHLSTRLLGIALASKVDPMRMSSQLRWCPVCMMDGYHSVVHQFESVQRCPIHRHTLEVLCRSCQEPSAYRLHAKLLDAPYRCGHCGMGFATYLRWQKQPCSYFAPIRRTRLYRLHF